MIKIQLFSEIAMRTFNSDQDRNNAFRRLFYRLNNLESAENARAANAIENAGTRNVMLSSDIHFFKDPEKDDLKIRMHNRAVDDSKVWIFLGDIGYKHVNPDPDLMREKIEALNKGRFSIFIQGNHDILGVPFYRSCGFDMVLPIFTWREIVFSHAPVRIPKNTSLFINVHGHLHNWDIEEYANVYPENYFGGYDRDTLNTLYIKIYTNKDVNYSPVSLFDVLSRYVSSFPIQR